METHWLKCLRLSPGFIAILFSVLRFLLLVSSPVSSADRFLAFQSDRIFCAFSTRAMDLGMSSSIDSGGMSDVLKTTSLSTL